MAESSYEWTTSAAGDGASTYTRSDLSLRAKVLAACMDDEGIAPGLLNALAPTVTGANTVQINTGGALVDGKPYYNSAAVNVNIPSASGGGNTRIDRVVLRADWTAQTVRITRIAGVDAASPTVPAITQTTGVTYDVLLCQCLVNTSGTVTITDERTLAIPASGVIPTSSIANRARKFMASVTGTLNNDLTAALMAGGNYGPVLKDGNTCKVDGVFIVPSDYASGMTVKALIISQSASGNVVVSGTATGGQSAAAPTVHSVSFALAAVAITLNIITAIWTLDLSTASFVAGDVVLLTFNRTGASASDTINNDANFAGFLVEYTADS